MANSSFILLRSEWIAKVVFFTTAVLIRKIRQVEVNISFNVVAGEVADLIPDEDKLKAISHAKHWPKG